MNSSNRLKKNSDFIKVYRRGRSLSDRNLVLIYRKTGFENSRIGFSVSKKFGNAVERNRIKRQLKSICRELLSEIKSGYDMVFVVRVESRQADFRQLHDSIYGLLKRAKLCRKKQEVKDEKNPNNVD